MFTWVDREFKFYIGFSVEGNGMSCSSLPAGLSDAVLHLFGAGFRFGGS